MKGALRTIWREFIGSYFEPLLARHDRQNDLMRALAADHFRTRAVVKRAGGHRIHVVLVCHLPSLWNMFEPVYREALADPRFEVTVVTVPYSHSTLPKGSYKDDGMFEYLKGRGVEAVRGYSAEGGTWLDPAALRPDFVFFQTPYNLFSPLWNADRVSMLAKVCFIPYATALFRGEVDEQMHPVDFLRSSSLVFAESPAARAHLVDKFRQYPWFAEKEVVLSGYPKLDYLTQPRSAAASQWKRGERAETTRILWTPRWRTSEGTCHFFDYKDYFAGFCRKHAGVDFVLRPHPLCFQNFINTGEMSQVELDRMLQEYDASPNMAVDTGGDYQGAFLSSHILISDISSMILEFFATGKPIIYTHRVDVFNDLGRRVSEGCYWVKNQAELDEVLNLLVSGKDPMRPAREKLIQELFFLPEGGSGAKIKESLAVHFQAAAGICN